MQYTIIIVATLALVLGFVRYRHPGRRKFACHERFRPIKVLKSVTEPVKGSFGLHLWK